MKKNYVLDTNVLLHDPDASLNFEDNNVNVPITVIEEIDQFKKGLDEIGRNARMASRLLDGLRQKGDLRTGVLNDGGGLVRVLFGQQGAHLLPKELALAKEDNRILAVCLMLRESEELPVVLVSKDTNLRIKANAVGVNAEDYERGRVRLEEVYTGTSRITLPAAALDHHFKEGGVPVDEELYDNQYVLLVDEENPNHTALGRYRKEGNHVVPLCLPKSAIFGIRPRNLEQHYCFDALLDPEIQLVTLMGMAGTGKTLLALAAGLQKTVEEKTYQRMLVSRPIFPMGRDIGFLPGDIQDKLLPWMQPIFDNVELLLSGMDSGRPAERERGARTFNRDGREQRRRKGVEELVDMDVMAIEPLTYIRGRSIPYQYIIVDEAQNLTPHEIKTIITRAGEGTKIVLTGDPYQIDHPYIDATSNGLSFCVERFKESPIAAHVTLLKGERSSLAEMAANLL